MPRVATKLQTPVQLAIRLNQFDGYYEKVKTFFTPGETFDAVYGIAHKGRNSDNPHWHFAVEAWFPKDTVPHKHKIALSGIGKQSESRQRK